MSDSPTDNCNLDVFLRQLPFLGGFDPAGQRVFVRADFHVPLDNYGAMVDDGRLRAVLPTINYLLDHGARVIVGGHLRNPLAGGPEPDQNLSFSALAHRLSRIWEVEVELAPGVVGPETSRAAANLAPGRVLLLENLRFHPGEISGDPDFARQLASLADLYVNDAFGVCHRDHASMTTITRFAPACVAGFALRNELLALHRALSHPAHPLGAIIGGSHIEFKLPVVDKLMGLADYLFLGGAMGDAFSRLAYGSNLDHLGLSPASLALMARLLDDARHGRAKLLLPLDVMAVIRGEDPAGAQPMSVLDLTADYVTGDIGPATRLLYQEVLAGCRTIIWNGPMGASEIPAFTRGTALMTKILAECPGVTLAGGVDTSAAILKMSDRSQVSFLSAGGSAFLEAMAGRPLAALTALMDHRPRKE